MTIKSLELLYAADAVVYDDLAPKVALAYCRPGAQVVYVGKRGGVPSMKQPEIDRLLVELCSAGLQVVRLKGGCSTLFSRAGSEIRALKAAGVPCELVPGVSSPSAAAAAAGFPLTDTDAGRSFATLSAHNPASINWAALTPEAVDALALLMGASQLPRVVEAALDAGWAQDCPVVVVRSAGTADARVWAATLGTVVRATQGESLSPCVILIGQVAGAVNAADAHVV